MQKKWRKFRNLATVGLMGLSSVTQAFDQPIRLSSLEEVFNQSQQMLVLGQDGEYEGEEEEMGDEHFTSLETNTTGAACGGDSIQRCGKGCNGCDDCIGDWRDNTVFWFGGDAFKSFGDIATPAAPDPLALHSNFGLVTGMNTGFGLGDSRVRGQAGASYGAYDLKGRSTTGGLSSDDSLEQQVFVTVGLYKRSDVCDGDNLSWAVAWDEFVGHQWGWQTNELHLSQVRYLAGVAVNDWNEIGFWGTFQTTDDEIALTPGGATRVHAMNQFNSYLRHNWEFGATTMAYVGVLDNADIGDWVFGLLGESPMSNRAALYGNFTYVTPSSATGLVGAAEDTWNVSAGLVLYVGGKAVQPDVSGRQGLPLLPVANNGSFLVTD